MSLLRRFREAVIRKWPRERRPAPVNAAVTFSRRRPILIKAFIALAIVGVGIFAYVYLQYAMMIEQKLGGGAMRTYSAVFAAPRVLHPDEEVSADQIIDHLRRCGYTEDAGNRIGWFRLTNEGLEVATGPDSYYQPHSALLQFNGNRLTRIVSRTNRANSSEFALEPEIVTNLFDETRAKRKPVLYSELPKHLVGAIVSVEDKRFFQHSGLDLLRIAKAAYVDIKERRKEQGASTITMQVARTFWLDQEKNWGRKFAEALLSAELERRLTKEQIMELYANEVYLGRRGSFGVHGFGQAAHAYFGKDIRELTISESAMLAAIIQRPGHFNPFRYPERVKTRRDMVLKLMHENEYIDARQLTESLAEPISLRPGEVESADAPYFIDLINEDLQTRFQDWDFASDDFRVYTTLDLDLQRAAVEAVQAGMAEVDKALMRKRGKKGGGQLPQVALVALDPHTGAIKALVGGRSYAKTQLNRAVAKRQPGSSFKPFVYAAALNTGLETKRRHLITPATTLVDEPTTFMFNRQRYEPSNFGDQFYGGVTLRQALYKSLNIPTIKVAEMVGFEKVAALAREAGIQSPMAGTPSLALGSYEVTPLEIAQAYTIFANEGKYLPRTWFTAIRDRRNQTVYADRPEPKQVLDPRVAFLMVNMMEDVLVRGTGAAVRSRGFKLPAAGKTGTSRDGWFAGFTSKLLCVVWIGYDDNAELELEGSKSALPVWAQFMTRAHQFLSYRGATEFKAPKGIVRISIDPETGMRAGPNCEARSEYFIEGTQPRMCPHDEGFVEPSQVTRDGERRGIFGRVLGVFR